MKSIKLIEVGNESLKVCAFLSASRKLEESTIDGRPQNLLDTLKGISFINEGQDIINATRR